MKMFIDGRWTDSSDGAVSSVINPATGVCVDTVPEATEQDVDRAIALAVEGQKESWHQRRQSDLFPTGQKTGGNRFQGELPCLCFHNTAIEWTKGKHHLRAGLYGLLFIRHCQKHCIQAEGRYQRQKHLYF